MALTAEESAELRASVRASVESARDARRVSDEIGALDLLEGALPSVSIFFEEFGRAGLASDLSDALVRDALGLDAADGPAFAFALPHSGRSSAVSATNDSDGLSVAGLVRAPGGEPPSELIVITGTGDAIVLASADLHSAAVPGFDPDGGWFRISGQVPAGSGKSLSSDGVVRAIALARLCLASEVLGAATTINTIAIDHVTSRHQFGKALGSFQSVRHRLAETHVAIQAARPVLAIGWAQSEPADDHGELETYAKAAKALGGKAVQAAIRNANQVCGAMGLTWEHPLPALVRRGSVLDALLGDPVDLAADLGCSLAAGAALSIPDPLCRDDVAAAAR